MGFLNPIPFTFQIVNLDFFRKTPADMAGVAKRQQKYSKSRPCENVPANICTFAILKSLQIDFFYLKKTDGQAFLSEEVQKSSLGFNEKDSVFAAIPPFSIYIQSYFTQYLAYVLNLGASSYRYENNLIHKSHCADVGLLVPPQQQ